VPFFLLWPNARGWQLLVARTLPQSRGGGTRSHGWGWAGWRGVWLAGWLGAVMSGLGWFARRSLVAALRDGARSSDATLVGIVHLNAATDFGRRYGFDRLLELLPPPNAQSRSGPIPAAAAAEQEVVAAFKAAVPLARYDDLAPWVARIANGEQQVLTSEPIIQVRRR
jgi:hypothetical protein